MDALKTRWMDFCRRLGIREKVAEKSFYELVTRYSTPRRHYHTLEGHVWTCIRELDDVFETLSNLFAQAALWVHDACYDPQAHDNEAQSIIWMRNLFENMRISESFTDKTALIVEATTHAAPPHEMLFGTHGEKRAYDDLLDINAGIAMDADLSILGKSEQEFDTYEMKIREEYAFVPEPLFRKKRAEILEKILTREFIYNHSIFRKKYESRARENLAKSIKNLHGA